MIDETVQTQITNPAVPVDGAGTTRSPGLEVIIGSNIFRNTNGVVKIHGKEQLVLEPRPDQGLLLLTLDLYGEGGVHLAHLRRNVFVLNPDGRFAVEVAGGGADATGALPTVRLVEHHTGGVVFEAALVSEHKVRIGAGKFYSHKGIPVEVTPHYCRIGSGMTRFGDIVENRGGTVVLG